MLSLFVLAALVCGGFACDRNVEELGGAAASTANCLPDMALTDQNGDRISLPSLRGKPLLFDFIYTTCPGPCLVLTARMKAIADLLGPELGKEITFVSVTVDPEHDHPEALKAYAREQGALRDGWYFLTGDPSQIDRLMAQFKLRRQRQSDGSVDHVLEFFLVAADGHPELQYLAGDANPAKIASELRDAAAGRRFAGLP